MENAIRFDEALSAPPPARVPTLNGPLGAPTSVRAVARLPVSALPLGAPSRPPARITFDEALADRQANTHTYVQTDRLKFAQELGDKFPNEFPGEVPIEGFVRTSTPPLQPARGANFGVALKVNMVEDLDTKRRLIADSLFPGDPNAIHRVGLIDGQPAYVDERGQLRSVSSGPARLGATVLANAPETIGAALGGFAGSPVLGSTLGATGARGLKRAASGVLFDEPQTMGGNMADVAMEGAATAASSLLGKGIAGFADRGRIADFTPANVKNAEQVREYLKRSTGIDLDLAQASGNRKLIALRAYAARYPGPSAELIQAADELSQGQLDTAVKRVMDQVAKTAPAEVSGNRGVNAASMVIELAKAKRNQAVAASYQKAATEELPGGVADDFWLDPVLRDAANRVQATPAYQRDLGLGAMTVTREKGSGGVYRMVETPRKAKMSEDDIPGTIGFWHQVKQNLDDQIQQAADQPNKFRILSDARRSLNETLQEASPAYRQANAQYASATREIIEPLENSAVGVLSRITSPKAATAAAKIFSDPNIGAAEIRATRASIAAEDPEAWNGLVRQWIASRWNEALKETQTGMVINPAGKLRQALIGTPADKERMVAMLPPGTQQSFDDLMAAAQSLASTPIAGSNTMRDTEVKDQLKGTAAVAFRWLTSPRQSIKDAAEQRALENGTTAIAEAILDPTKRGQLRQIVKMAPSTRKAIMLSTILGGKAARVAAESDPDVMPDEAY